MNKFRHVISATLAALAITALGAGTAFATEEEGVNANSVKVPFTHVMNAGANADIDDVSYTVSIVGKVKDSGEGVIASQDATGVSIVTKPFAAGTIVPKAPSPATTSSSETQKTWISLLTLAELFGSDVSTDSTYSTFTQNFKDPGYYKFSITENRTGTADKWSYTPTGDGPHYELTVWIKNNEGDPNTRHYEAWVLKAASGDKVAVSNEDGSVKGADFTSSYTAKGNLKVEKQVAGEYASTTHRFKHTITLTLPAGHENDSITPAVSDTDPKADGKWVGSTTGLTRTYEVNLKHGESVTFENLPVGTRYSVQEATEESDGKQVAKDDAQLKYEPSITFGKSAPSVPEDFTNITASELSALSQALKDNKLTSDQFGDLLGEQVAVSVDGIEKKARLVDAGNNGLTFMFESLDNYYMNPTVTNAGGWPASDLRKSLNTTEGTHSTDLYNKLANMTIGGESVSVAEKTTKSVDYNGGTVQVIESQDKFWIPNVVEVYGSWPNGWGYTGAEDSTQLGLFQTNNISPEAYNKIPELTVSAWWWLRSANPSNYNTFMLVRLDGYCDDNSASLAGGVLPCFCL